MQCTIVSQRVEPQLESEPTGDPGGGGGMNQTWTSGQSKPPKRLKGPPRRRVLVGGRDPYTKGLVLL